MHTISINAPSFTRLLSHCSAKDATESWAYLGRVECILSVFQKAGYPADWIRFVRLAATEKDAVQRLQKWRQGIKDPLLEADFQCLLDVTASSGQGHKFENPNQAFQYRCELLQSINAGEQRSKKRFDSPQQKSALRALQRMPGVTNYELLEYAKSLQPAPATHSTGL